MLSGEHNCASRLHKELVSVLANASLALALSAHIPRVQLAVQSVGVCPSSGSGYNKEVSSICCHTCNNHGFVVIVYVKPAAAPYAGEQETRAWTIRDGFTAPQAAGVIHTDFERGFIRAETVAYNQFTTVGGFGPAREKGVLRLEGKEYIVKEGDVMLFRFNV